MGLFDKNSDCVIIKNKYFKRHRKSIFINLLAIYMMFKVNIKKIWLFLPLLAILGSQTIIAEETNNGYNKVKNIVKNAVAGALDSSLALGLGYYALSSGTLMHTLENKYPSSILLGKIAPLFVGASGILAGFLAGLSWLLVAPPLTLNQCCRICFKPKVSLILEHNKVAYMCGYLSPFIALAWHKYNK